MKRLNAGIETCVDRGDNGSRELLEGILTDEEEHIDWLEAQLHAISEMGIENYLAQHLHDKKADNDPIAEAASRFIPLPIQTGITLQ